LDNRLRRAKRLGNSGGSILSKIWTTSSHWKIFAASIGSAILPAWLAQLRQVNKPDTRLLLLARYARGAFRNQPGYHEPT
jgi:hypothetical protein